MNFSLNRFHLLIAIIGAFMMPFLTGFLGLLPLDQSIIFEAGGRISMGEKPFTDFHLPYGLSTSIMQAAFFKVLGISWFAYVFHAAFINAMFAALLFDVLNLWLPDESARKKFAITLLASWSFYPMMGTPFMDNHSFFFGFFAYWAILAGNIRKRPILLLISFSLLVFGFYSKPLPVIFWIFPILLECWLNRAQFRFYIRWLVPGLIFSLLFLVLPLFVLNADQFYFYTYLLPLKIGQARVNMNTDNNPLVAFVANERYKIWVGLLIILISYFLFRVKLQQKNIRLAFYRSSCLLFVSVIGAALTINTFYNLVSTAVVISFGILYCFDYSRNRLWIPPKLYEGLFQCGWIVLIVMISWINFSRRVNEMIFHVEDLSQFSPEMGFFAKTFGNRYSPNDFQELFQLMKTEHSLYIGDMMFLYSMTGGHNPWPVIHLHDGTSYDSKDSTHFTLLQKQFLSNIQKYQSSVIIEDILFYGQEPFVQFANQLKGRRRKKIGALIIYEVDKEKLDWMVSNLNRNFAR